MKSNIVIGAILTLAASAFSLSAMMSYGWQSEASLAAGIESRGFDILAHRVFGGDAGAQAQPADTLLMERHK